MSLIMTDPAQWVCEHCATKEDVLYYIVKLQEIYDAWEDELEDDKEE